MKSRAEKMSVRLEQLRLYNEISVGGHDMSEEWGTKLRELRASYDRGNVDASKDTIAELYAIMAHADKINVDVYNNI